VFVTCSKVMPLTADHWASAAWTVACSDAFTALNVAAAAGLLLSR
jgi:hypothetical protein